MTFATSPDLWLRSFEASWAVRAESAVDIAGRIHGLVGRLRAMEPAWAEIWPHAEFRAVRDYEPPVLELSIDDLGRIIDRRFRFDPPQLPAPVSASGYSIFLSGRRGDLPLSLSLSIQAGDSPSKPHWRSLRVCPSDTSPVWGSPASGAEVVRAMVEAFDPDWVLASGLRLGSSDRRPWLAWGRPGASPAWELEAAEPARRRDSLAGGDLMSWP